MKVISAVTKKAVFVVLGFGLCAGAFAYNPPVQGENLSGFINPNQITAGFSTVGGPLFTITPAGVMANPALGAYQNRVSLDLGYTGIITGDEVYPYAQSFGTGVLVPTKWFNFSAEAFGMFSRSERMQLGDSVNFKTTFSKEVVENFAVGAGLGAGYMWGAGEDWNLVFDVGAVYKWGELGPMKNFRLGASVLNLGKVYNRTYTQGIWHKNNCDEWSTYPGFMVIKAGAAAEFVNAKNFVLGLSLDVSTPFFQNVIIDAGVEMLMFNFVVLSSSWEFDMQSLFAGKQSWLPTVGLSFKFGLDTSFTKKSDWSKSDIEVGTAWKNVTQNVNAISVGTVINLGQPDRNAPEIKMNAIEEEEE
ncbi:hypothetical protein [Treponema sp.]|uniref:hypothetical protein n=1 Tax=Treponema sp. TaxID=166 RepID=UPI00298E0B9A|nr:hypothetical protein [Treponema sp.]MCR5613801.1 hypothetical protein [Treponema sp.]